MKCLASAAGAVLRLGRDQRPQARVVLPAGRAALEVSAHAGDRLVGAAARQLELDIPVELLEALLAADLGPSGAEQPANELVAWLGLVSHLLPPTRAFAEAFVARRGASCRGRRAWCRAGRRERRS